MCSGIFLGLALLHFAILLSKLQQSASRPVNWHDKVPRLKESIRMALKKRLVNAIDSAS